MAKCAGAPRQRAKLNARSHPAARGSVAKPGSGSHLAARPPFDIGTAMARDQGLEELLHGDLDAVPGLQGKAMFGGWAWLVNGNLLCGARHDGMLVRLGKGRDGWALEVPGVAPMIMRGRRMEGWVRAAPETCGDDALRGKLLEAALAFNRSLPAK